MTSSIKIEFPIPEKSNLALNYKTIGGIKKAYPNIKLIKYIYIDPVDKKLKCDNPPDNLPIVVNSYLIIIGETDEVLQFMITETKITN